MPAPNTIEIVLGRLVICEPTTLETGCWEYGGYVTDDGYGFVRLGGKGWLVHKLVYAHFKGDVPEGRELDHLCRNRACAHFDHVEPVTRAVNLERGINWQREKTHCPKGHPLSGCNLYVPPGGGRECLECRRVRSRLRARQRRAAARC